MKADILCWAVTPKGVELARTIASGTGADVRAPARLALPHERPYSRLAAAVVDSWDDAKAHVFVAATGIVVRAIAPLVRSKEHDPAVVVCDQNGRYAISLLSGHIGQANTLARRVAAVIGGEAVITTATDCAGLPAFDELAVLAGCAIGDIQEAKAVSAALLEGRRVRVEDPWSLLTEMMHESFAGCSITRTQSGYFVTPRELDCSQESETKPPEVVVGYAPSEAPGRLCLYPKHIWAGVGCRRGVEASAIVNAVRRACDEAVVSPLALAGLASADIKQNEPGLAEAATCLGVSLRFFNAETLAALEVPHPSAEAAQALGVERVGVCEAAALLAAGISGEGARLVREKRVFDAHGCLLPDGGGVKGSLTVALAAPRVFWEQEKIV